MPHMNLLPKVLDLLHGIHVVSCSFWDAGVHATANAAGRDAHVWPKDSMYILLHVDAHAAVVLLRCTCWWNGWSESASRYVVSGIWDVAYWICCFGGSLYAALGDAAGRLGR